LPASEKYPKANSPPYPLLYLERMLRDDPVDVRLVDEAVEPQYEGILESVSDRLLLAGVSAMTGHQIEGGIRFSRAVKSMCNAPVVWGGWHPSMLPEETLVEPFVDFVVSGPGEIPFRDLVRKLARDEDVTGIPSLAFQDGHGVCQVNPESPLIDLTRLAPVDYSLIDVNDYVHVWEGQRTLRYPASHGCPFHCGFCAVARMFKRHWYPKRIDDIMEDLTYFKRVANIESVMLEDDNFFVKRSFVVEFCERLIESGLDLTWISCAHAGQFLSSYCDDDIALMKRAGCKEIYIGAESGDQGILDLISKGTTVEDNLEFVTRLKAHGIKPVMSTMVGFPTDDPERDIDATLKMLMSAKLSDTNMDALVFFYTPYPGTRLHEMAVERGFRPPERLEDWATFTFRRYRAPWLEKDHGWTLETFVNFYFPLVNRDLWKRYSGYRRWAAFVLTRLFSPIATLRFRRGFLRFPVEARLFLLSLRLLNRISGKDLGLSYGSFVDH